MKPGTTLKISLIIITFLTVNIMAQGIRPIKDSVGFCWLAGEMDQLLNYLKDHSAIDENSSSQNLVAAISPHDDYLYAGSVYFPLYKLIKAKEVVIFGVTHGTVRKAFNDPKNLLIMDDFSQWHGPYSNVEISPLRDFIKGKLNRKYFIVNDGAQSMEHSIEALVPFLQYYNRNVKITPIMVTEMPFDSMEVISDNLTKVISSYIEQNHLTLGKDIFFLISSDANHYGIDFNNQHFGLDEKAHRLATLNDREVANKYFSGQLEKNKIKGFADVLWGKTNEYAPLWCGKFSIPFGLLTVNKIVHKTTGKALNGKIFRYSDSWTEGVIPIKHTNMGLTAPFSLKHWVGYLSAGFYLE